jgi:DNA-binding LacI/PurR family transcriptional regulator
MQEAVTVRELAKICNVSAATVSRVLSGSGYPVRQSVKDRILQTAKEAGYASARGPAGNTADARGQYPAGCSQGAEVAVLVPTTTNPFYTSLIKGFEHTAVMEGCGVILYNAATGFPKNDQQRIVNSILSKNLQGAMIAASNNDPMLNSGAVELQRQGVKIVMADSPKPDYRFNCVSFDYEKGSFMGTRYLIDKGHRKIVYAGLTVDRESRHLRINGYRRAMEACRLPVRKEDILILPDDIEESPQTTYGEKMSELILTMNPRPTAVVAVNDEVAMGLLRGFHEEGIQIPADISVMGFDDSPYSAMSYPALTTIRVQADQMGQMAAMLLFADIKGASSAPVNLFLEPCVIERDTVARIA